jgi:hypothetical protein
MLISLPCLIFIDALQPVQEFFAINRLGQTGVNVIADGFLQLWIESVSGQTQEIDKSKMATRQVPSLRTISRSCKVWDGLDR